MPSSETLGSLISTVAVPGHLYIVATPIGNLEDLTLRAWGILRSVDLIAAEDTRRTRKLLSHYGISAKLVSYHTHNAGSRGAELIRALQEGKAVALVSDAGTPGFSDPGTQLVAQAWAAGLPVTAIPGPAAGVAALSMSGFSGEVTFVGFLPRQPKKRLEVLAQLAREPRILIFYESPRRLLQTLEELNQLMADRQILVVRELTKLFEEAWRGPVGTVLAQLSERQPRGEFTLVLGPPPQEKRPTVSAADFILAAAQDGTKSGRTLAQEAAETLGISRRQAYQTLLALQAAGKLPKKLGTEHNPELDKESSRDYNKKQL